MEVKEQSKLSPLASLASVASLASQKPEPSTGRDPAEFKPRLIRRFLPFRHFFFFFFEREFFLLEKEVKGRGIKLQVCIIGLKGSVGKSGLGRETGSPPHQVSPLHSNDTLIHRASAEY